MALVPQRRRYGAAGLVVLLGLTLSTQVWRYARHAENESVHAEFLRRAQTQASLARERLLLNEEMIYSLRAAFLGKTQVSRREFADVANDLLQRHTAVQALEWVVILPGDQRARLEQAATRELDRPFVIQRRTADNRLVPAPPADEYLPILYLEPLAGNETVLGYDISSAPTAATIAQARRERKLEVSRSFHLQQSADPTSLEGVVFILPVIQPATNDVVGVVQGVFHVTTLLAQAHELNPDNALASYYFDLDTAPAAPVLLYANLAGHEPLRGHESIALPALDAPADFHDAITIGDRHWLLLIRMNPAWAAQQRSGRPDLLLAAGIAVTTLLGLLVFQLQLRTTRVEHEVAVRTAELRESESRLQAILDHDSSIVFLKDRTGRYIFANQAFRNFFRVTGDQVQNKTDYDMYEPAIAEAYQQVDRQIFATGQSFEFEDFIRVPDGTQYSYIRKFPLRDKDGHVYAVCGVATDITRFKQAEAEKLAIERQLLESRRLESLGVLAGGIAHDFNNILTAVLGNASLAKLQLPAASPVAATIGQIEHAARRAADLCSQMLAYAGKGSYVAVAVDVSTLVRDTLALLEVSVAKGTRLHLDLAKPLPTVQADATQLRQIIMNLVLNAGDAIGAKPGEIRLSTYVREVRADFFRDAVRAPHLPSGRYVGLEVSDNGAGMPPEVLTRIFEPFFTTKFSGRGLGLAAVLGIVQSHHGALFVDSEPGRGTTFKLFLPASNLPAAAMSTPPMDIAGDTRQVRGTVLIVDDEVAVRKVARHSLARLGARVLEAADGATAIRLVGEYAGTIDLILLDLTMPGLPGEETLRQLRTMDHQHKVVIMSGYSEAETAQRCTHLGAVEFLAKPFELSTLLATVRTHLNEVIKAKALR